MKRNDYKGNRNDYIVRIIQLNVNLGIKDADEFVYYITNVLANMTTKALEYELEDLEINAIGLSM